MVTEHESGSVIGRVVRSCLTFNALAWILVLAACEPRDAASTPGAAGLLANPDRHLLTIGLGRAPSTAVFSTIVAARLTEDGEHVVVLDAAPPFVRVFDRRGGAGPSFLGGGSGPLEARLPSALAVSGSAVFVGGAERRYWIFDLGGRLLDQASGLDFLPLAATAGHGGEWMVYGPRASADGVRAAGVTHWLHRVRPGGATQSFVGEAAPDRPIGIGIGYGMVTGPGGVVVRHDFGAVPSIVSWPADSSAPSITPIPGMQARPPAGGAEREGRRTFRVEAGSRVQIGVAATARGVVVADFVAGRPGGAGDRTEFRRIGGGRVAAVPGMYRIHDSRAGVGVLLGAPEPVPHLFLVSEADFLAMLDG